MRSTLAAASLLACTTAAQANLIANPSNELPLVAGNISGWSVIVGTPWERRGTNPSAFDGTVYFSANNAPDGTLRQTVDVSSFAAGIDASRQQFSFSGWVTSFAQANPDTARIVLRYLSGGNGVLATFDSGEIASTTGWQEVSDVRIAPVLTRAIQIDLIAHRNAGTNNDGYFDALSLDTVLLPVPEPGQYLLMGLGIAVVLARRKVLRRKPA